MSNPENKIKRRTTLKAVSALFAFSLLVALTPSANLAAQTTTPYPTKPITLVIPFPAGSGTDAVGRIMALELGKKLGQQVIIENKPGGNATIGAQLVARAQPDGYTLMMGVDSLPVNPLLIKGLSYDTFKDLQPVSMLARVPLVLITPSTSQINNLSDLIKAARAQPDRLSYASPGSGTSNHLYMELLNTKSGNEMIHIPYKGGGPAITDLMGGQVDTMLISVTLAAPQLRAGKLKALAVTGETRSVLLPGVKTFPELGYADMVTYTWGGLFLPAGTPQTISQRIFNDFSKSIHQPEIVARFRDLGAEVVMNSPSEFTALLQTTRDKMAELIASKKISF
jgi:tripartite-type tricarboxylate transporter receptor subunit TctC